MKRTVRNSTVLEPIRSSQNEALDTAAFEKSLNEKTRGVLLGLFDQLILLGEHFLVGVAGSDEALEEGQ